MYRRRRNPDVQRGLFPGINDDPIIEGLQNLLSDTYILYIKVQNFHWNVTGPHFGALHKMFDDHYLELAAANDLIAERVRAVGGFAVGSCVDFNKRSNITESLWGREIDSTAMIQELYKDNQLISQECRKFLKVLDDADDEITAQLVADRALAHEKVAWMLKAHLE